MNDESPAPEPRLAQIRRGRGLPDKILQAFHMACDQNDLEIARLLVQTLEAMLTRRPQPENDLITRRRHNDSLVAAYERLWALRHRD